MLHDVRSLNRIDLAVVDEETERVRVLEANVHRLRAELREARAHSVTTADPVSPAPAPAPAPVPASPGLIPPVPLGIPVTPQTKRTRFAGIDVEASDQHRLTLRLPEPNTARVGGTYVCDREW